MFSLPETNDYNVSQPNEIFSELMRPKSKIRYLL